MTWHVPADTVRAYVHGRIADADAWSVEAHLSSCEQCRAELAAEASHVPALMADVDSRWSAVAADLPAQGRVRRGTVWRELVVLVTAGPAARWAWLTASLAVLALAAGVGAITPMTGGGELPLLGMVAPLVPILGVAASYGSGLDDAHEVIASTPGGGLRLLLMRSVTVLAASSVIAVAAGLFSGYGSPVPWLLASLALVMLTLAFGSLLGVGRAAAAVGGGWAVAVTVATLDAPADAIPSLLTVEFAPVWLVLAVVAALVVTVRRDAFDHIILTTRH
ncbi:zf-HC2 domain-containing protein [Phytoactinopolyspora alkaliphila]|uniref:Zf-HC2 domain-containing protein n=1 Tax=Phytoactinopolyspora alkaliphila TaxID=1783498 RepID=A0A6N9YP41_9ACTN|nr:zf-HC2 domain-containing protein [Phytoactinopolyspora alkaliphila]NED96742.1 zf-HC2 domain-containing protein [Phytoactinopolyspora alkaliphila]